MTYVNYAYYTDNFKGKLIPSTDFDYFANEASAYLDSLSLGKITTDKLTDKIKLCACKCAELYYKAHQRDSKSSESVGSYSVSFEKVSLDTQLLDTARLYLGMTGLLNRGVY